MLRPASLWGSLLLAPALLAGTAFAQVRAVEGTEQVPNEYGGTFPREIVWEKDGSVMVLVPHGSFKRGAEGENADPNNQPIREITLPSFYIDKHEVSNAMYQGFLNDGGTSARPRPSDAKLLEASLPVTALPWLAASSYAKWSGKQLPTEAMWEKAARGPENTLFTTGNSEPAPGLLVVARGASSMPVPTTEDTGDVSGYGALHMGGNVSEWVADYYAREYYRTAPAENPTGPAQGETRVVRGGNFRSPMREARTVYRDAVPETHHRDEIGFRTVWVPQRPIPQSERPTPSPTLPPPPTRAEVVAALKAQLIPFLERDAARLPSGMMAGKAFFSKGEDEVQFANFTPYRLSLSFVGPNENLVYKYNEPLPPMSFRNVTLPRERDLNVLMYALDAPRKGPIDAGSLRAESQAIVIIRSEFFSPVQVVGGSTIHPQDNVVAEQYYGDYSPQWNEMELQNNVDMAISVRIGDISRDPNNPQNVQEYILDQGELLRLTLTPGARYRFTADYVGATEPSSEPVDVTIDARAARRMVRITRDVGDKTVTVITQRQPFLRADVMEARKIAFTPKDQKK